MRISNFIYFIHISNDIYLNWLYCFLFPDCTPTNTCIRKIMKFATHYDRSHKIMRLYSIYILVYRILRQHWELQLYPWALVNNKVRCWARTYTCSISPLKELRIVLICVKMLFPLFGMEVGLISMPLQLLCYAGYSVHVPSTMYMEMFPEIMSSGIYTLMYELCRRSTGMCVEEADAKEDIHGGDSMLFHHLRESL